MKRSLKLLVMHGLQFSSISAAAEILRKQNYGIPDKLSSIRKLRKMFTIDAELEMKALYVN